MTTKVEELEMMDTDYAGPDRRRGGPDRRDPGTKTKILLVDDHALFRVGMRQILEIEAGLRHRRRGRGRPRRVHAGRRDEP